MKKILIFIRVLLIVIIIFGLWKFISTSGVVDAPVDIPVDTHADLIKVSTPLVNDVIISPLAIKGEARGNWYFEASFSVHLYDANGVEVPLSPGYIMVTGEWMTTEFVPFEASLTFIAPNTATGTLVLEKDNASGLPEFDDKISIPVRFSQ